MGTRLLGFLCWTTALFAGRGAIEELVVTDGFISNRAILLSINATRIGLGLVGLYLILRSPRLERRVLAGLTAVLLLGATSTGVYGTGLNRDWLSHDVLDISAFCELTKHGNDPVLGEGILDELSRELERIRATPGRELGLVAAHRELSNYLLRHNRVADAIENLERAVALAEGLSWPPEQIDPILVELGVAHLRVGELLACVRGVSAESCIFPIADEAIWADREAGQIAIGYFEQVLESEPEDMRARWLLNVAHMAIGSFPNGIDPRFRLPEKTVSPRSEDAPVFRNIAPELGLHAFNILGGAIVDDFDNDGHLDIVTSSSHPCDPMIYYHANGDGNFEDWSTRSSLAEHCGGANLVQADYNDDGLLDILVLRGGWAPGAFGKQRNSLLKQNVDGTFEDVTLAAGLGARAYPSQTAAWADYDNDGDLDLYVGNERRPSQLFRNEGDGTFTDVARGSGVVNDAMAKGVTWGDYDNDGDPDLYVSNWGQPNRLYRNDGNGIFVDVAKSSAVDFSDEHDLSTFAVWFWDVNSDGWLDLFVGGYGAEQDLTPVVASYFDVAVPRAVAERLKVALGDGKGGFVDASAEMGIDRVLMPMGANFGDVDNDGFLDFYLGTGAPSFDFLVPNVLYRNVDGERFVDITTEARLGHLQKGHAIAFADIDGDGDQDIFAQMGGFYSADAFHNALFENQGTENHWVTIRLRGTESNHFGVGAQIRVHITEDGAKRTLFRWVGSGGSFGASSLQQEIGLGRAQTIDVIEIHWPTTGNTQRFTDVGADRVLVVVEGARDYSVVP